MTQQIIIEDIADLVGVFQDVVEQFQAITYEPVLAQASNDLHDLHREYFASESDPTGRNWPELSEATKQRKGHDRILWETSRLEASLVGVTTDSVRDLILEGHQEWLVWGTSVPYSGYHQDPQGGRLPKRAHVGVNAEFVDELTREVLDHTIEELKR